MLEPGKKAPQFTLPSSDGDDVSLKDASGKYVVLYFYPRDNTPGCTVEAQDFRDAMPKLKKLGAVVWGVSKDSIASHCKFRDKFELTFPLLSDADGKVLEAYGAWGEKTALGRTYMGIIRSTYLIDPDGRIVRLNPPARAIFGLIGAGIVLGQRLDREQWGNWPLGAALSLVSMAMVAVIAGLFVAAARATTRNIR